MIDALVKFLRKFIPKLKRFLTMLAILSILLGIAGRILLEVKEAGGLRIFERTPFSGKMENILERKR